MKAYCAHPISGLTAEEVVGYYEKIKSTLEAMGFDVFHPMTGKGEFRNGPSHIFDPSGYKSRVANNHSIFERDKWMVQQTDVLYLDLSRAQSISVGCMMELAWASLLGKHTIVIMEDDNIHKHAFVVEAADIVFDKEQDALEYMKKLIKGNI